MAVVAGDTLSIRHYSEVKMFKSVATRVQGNLIIIRLTKEFAQLNLLEGDPLVCGIDKDNIVYIYGCTVVKIKAKEKVVELNIDNINSSENKRQHERFPVSIYADIKLKNSDKKQLATIKDLSYYGISLLTKVELNHNDFVELDVYVDKSVVYVKGQIVRKIKHELWIEYGMSVLFDDITSLNSMKEYVKKLKDSQEKEIRKLKDV